MKKLNKILSIFFAAVFVLTIVTNTSYSFAENNNNGKDYISGVAYKNPILKDIDDNTETKDDSINNIAKATSTKSFNSVDKAAAYLKGAFVKRSTSVSFRLNKKNVKSSDLKKVYDIAIKHTSKSKSSEGDYLKCHINSCRYSGYVYSNFADVTYTTQYLTTAKQENEVNKKVKSILKKLNVSKKSDYDKVKAVHNYIINNVTYDNSLNKFSAYDSLVKGKVVCLGYASSTYKLLKELGVDNRVILGTGQNGVGHAWNICKINGKYYNIDNTWDDNITEYNKKMSYTFFLKNNKDFPEHKRDKAYNTSSFNKAYPMSSTSYNAKVKKPGAVKSISVAKVTKNSVTLKWAKTKGADGYRVYISTSKNGTYKKLGDTSKTSFTSTKLKSKTKYYYKVRAYKKANNTKYGGPVSKAITVKTK